MTRCLRVLSGNEGKGEAKKRQARQMQRQMSPVKEVNLRFHQSAVLKFARIPKGTILCFVALTLLVRRELLRLF